MIDFGRETCGNLEAAAQREWLATNGTGSYASGTVAGLLTRRYHGILIAALKPPVERTLLVAKLDETAEYDGGSYALSCNRWADGRVEPEGYRNIERFHLEGATPVWTYACADALLEKRIWMLPGANTTCIRYLYLRPSGAYRPLALSIRPLVNFRDHHGFTRSGELDLGVQAVEGGFRITPNVPPGSEPARPFHILAALGSPPVQVTARPQWISGYFLSVEAYRGEEPLDDHVRAGELRVRLEPGQSFTLVLSAEDRLEQDGEALWARRQAHESALLAAFDQQQAARRDREPQPTFTHPPAQPLVPNSPLAQLVLAADQFIVRRASGREPEGSSVIAGYPWFGDWGRDTMISLPGLALAAGRPQAARRILRTYAAYVDRGMLPNRFPDHGEQPEYNTADATLWYFEAIRAYHAATGDDALLAELFPVLQDILAWHQRGTRYHIRCDPQDGLLYAGEAGVQLTWMDVKIGDWVVTPRTGKAVEINALWYNALCSQAGFAHCLGEAEEVCQAYEATAQQARQGFARFWNPDRGFCYDVIDGPQGNDPSLRPNQLLAVSLHHSPLDPERARAVVDACARHLLTSHGLRSLAPGEAGYTGHYGGPRPERDAAYHQGTVWAWLIGPFASAHLRVYRDPAAARSFLTPLLRHLAGHGLGSISEIFDGDPPFTPRGCIAQAWSVAEALRAWVECEGD